VGADSNCTQNTLVCRQRRSDFAQSDFVVQQLELLTAVTNYVTGTSDMVPVR